MRNQQLSGTNGGTNGFQIEPDVCIGGKSFLTTEKLAQQTGLAKKTLEIRRSKGAAPRYFKIGNRVLYEIEDVCKWLETLFVEPANVATKRL